MTKSSLSFVFNACDGICKFQCSDDFKQINPINVRFSAKCIHKIATSPK